MDVLFAQGVSDSGGLKNVLKRTNDEHKPKSKEWIHLFIQDANKALNDGSNSNHVYKNMDFLKEEDIQIELDNTERSQPES